MIFNFGFSEEYKKNHPHYSHLFKLLDNYIEKNYDDRIKEIGDRVVIWDSSASCDINGEVLSVEKVLKREMIVIENKLTYIKNIDCYGHSCELQLDLILYDKDQSLKIRTNSELCRIVN